MYAVPVTSYTTDAVGPHARFVDNASVLRQAPGQLSKAWIRRSVNLGAFHLFDDRAVSSRATDGFDDLEVGGFRVSGELGALTGITDLVPLTAG